MYDLWSYGVIGLVVVALMFGYIEPGWKAADRHNREVLKSIQQKPQYVPFDKDYYDIGLLEPEIVMESIAQHTKWELEPPIALWVAECEEPLMFMGKKVPIETVFEEKPVVKWKKLQP